MAAVMPAHKKVLNVKTPLLLLRTFNLASDIYTRHYYCSYI